MSKPSLYVRRGTALAAAMFTLVGLAGCSGANDDSAAVPSGSETTPAVPSGSETTPAAESASLSPDAVVVEQRTPAEGTIGNVTVTASSVIVGDPDAPEVVTIYADMNCPHCQTLHGVMATDTAVWAESGDVAVEYVVVDYLGPRTTHAFSSRGANLLALVADKYPEAWTDVQTALFAIQPTSTTQDVTDEDLIAALESSGVTLTEDDVAALQGLAYSGWVDANTALAAQAGVNYIPQVWIDGALVAGETHDETAELVRQAVTN